MAEVPVTIASAAAPHHRRFKIRSETKPTMRFPLLPNPMGDCVYPFPLNAGLATEAFQSQMKSESAALPERPDMLIVTAPREAKLQAFVLV